MWSGTLRTGGAGGAGSVQDPEYVSVVRIHQPRPSQLLSQSISEWVRLQTTQVKKIL